jgi:hypothetical protein
LTGLRGGPFKVAYSLRQHGTSYFAVLVFALEERKNKNSRKIKYHSAEGKNKISEATA